MTRRRSATKSRGISVKSFKGLNKKRMQKKSGGGGIAVVLKQGDTLPLQFLQTPEDFVEYEEHQFFDGQWYYVPCLGDDCPLCEDDDRDVSKTTYRFVCNVYNLKEKKVQVWAGPKDAAHRIYQKYERKPGVFLKRVFDISKFATTPVSYAVDLAEEDPVAARQLKLHDLDAYLDDQVKRYYGDDMPEAGGSSLDEDDEDDLDDEDVDVEDDEDEGEEEDGELEIYEEEDLNEMEPAELKEIAAELDIDIKKGMRKTTIVKMILEAQESDEDEDAEDEDEDLDDDDLEDDDELDEDDDDFDVELDDDDEDDDEDLDDDDDEDEDEEDERPAPRRRSGGRPAKRAPAKKSAPARRAPAKKAASSRKAPAKKTTARSRKAPAKKTAGRRGR